MKTRLLFFLFFLGICPFCMAQQNPIIIEKSDTLTYNKRIDSLYKPALGAKGVFKKDSEVKLIELTWIQMLSDLSDFLYDQKYRWRFNMTMSCTVCFSKGETVDYFIYDFDKNFLLPKDEENFVRLLKLFFQDYRLPFDNKTAFKISGKVDFN